MKSLLRPAVAAGLVLLAGMGSGCATITRGRSEAWIIDSTPSGATVSLSNGERCETPCTLKLRRKYPFSVEVCKAGFHTVNTTVQSEISGAGAAGMAGNVLIGGVIGAGVDAGTGATKDLRPNPLNVQLVAEAPGCLAAAFPHVPEDGETPEEHKGGPDKDDKAEKKVAAQTPR
jgi:hypothetical protein